MSASDRSESITPSPQAGVLANMQIFDADVIVVGGGGSGLAAAIEAARAGCAVILIEKNPRTGGSTGWSVGSITATRTPDQRRSGISDDPQHHFEDMAKFAGAPPGRDNLELRRMLTENVTETVAWLRELGVEFFGPVSEPPHRLPRMHNVLPTSGAYVYHLMRAARRAGVDIRVGVRATRIVLDGERISGIEAIDSSDRELYFRARRAAVLAGGDYSGSAVFKERFGSPALAAVPAVNETNTGDCQQMVLDIGGEVLNGDLMLGPVMRFVKPARKTLHQRIPPHRFITRPMAWMLHHLPASMVRPLVMRFMTTVLGPQPELFADGVLLVDRDGRKVEPLDGSYGKAVAATPGGMAWMIFDEDLARRYSAPPNAVSTAPGIAWAYFTDYVRTRPDLHQVARTPQELASKLDMPPAVFDDALQSHTGNGPGANGGAALRQPPFHSLGPIRSYMVLTDGGVKVTSQLQVVIHRATVVHGLYAAGSTGQGGLLLEGHGHHLGWAFTSGRIAGRNAAHSGEGIDALSETTSVPAASRPATKN